MITKLRPFIQLFFLAVFILLMFIGKQQLWMLFIFSSVLLATIFGRYYCGFACPINTLIRPINWIKKKFNKDKKNIPNFFKSKVLKYSIFIIFIVALALTIYNVSKGKKSPLPLIIITLGLITTFFVNERTWHKYLCPWGMLFSLTSRFSKLGIKVSDKCISCKICSKECPSDSIQFDSSNDLKVDKTHCILCFECSGVCSVNAVNYGKLSDDKSNKKIT